MERVHPRVVDPGHPQVQLVRGIAMRFPEAAEVEAWGRPTFRAGKKIFVMVSASMDDPLTIVFKPGSADERRAYLERPGFYSPPYWGPGGWLAVPIAGTVDAVELAEIIDTSYRGIALVRQVKALDQATDQEVRGFDRQRIQASGIEIPDLRGECFPPSSVPSGGLAVQ